MWVFDIDNDIGPDTECYVGPLPIFIRQTPPAVQAARLARQETSSGAYRARYSRRASNGSTEFLPGPVKMTKRFR